MGLIALTSLPSITPKMNWREWRVLQSHTGWLAVITATVRQHTLCDWLQPLLGHACSACCMFAERIAPAGLPLGLETCLFMPWR